MTLKLSVADDQLGQYYRKMAAIADRLGKSLPFDDVMAALQRVHDGQFDGRDNTQTAITRVLEFVQTVELADCEGIVPEEKFPEGKTVDGVKIAYIGKNFQKHFRDGKGKTEGVAAATLRVHKLKEASLDAPMLAELGDTTETKLSQFWAMLKKQGTGQKGPLLVNGYANIAYIRDMNGTLWAVRANWYDHGWDVDASAVSDPYEWRTDFHVVSR